MDRKRILREARDYVMLIIIGMAMTWFGVSCRQCRDNAEDFFIGASFTALVWIALWKGNEYLTNYLSTKISWLEAPVKRFIVGMICTVTYTLLAMYVVTILYNRTFNISISNTIWISVLITLGISFFLHGKSFLSNWRSTAIEAERIQIETLAAKHEALKNQINPHFLFNSLNALSNLVYEDEGKAIKFVDQLTEIYKYVLSSRDRELVPLEEELAFLESYLYLQQIRFEDKFMVEFALESRSGFVPPLALQMLVENAIKHNVVSADDPLTVRISTTKDNVQVSNNLQRKTSIGEESSGFGLENIRIRYKMLGNDSVLVTEDEKLFSVKLPLILSPVNTHQ